MSRLVKGSEQSIQLEAGLGCLQNLPHWCLFVLQVVLKGMLVQGAFFQFDAEFAPDAVVMRHSPPPPRSFSASAECISGGRLPRPRVEAQEESLQVVLSEVLATDGHN